MNELEKKLNILMKSKNVNEAIQVASNILEVSPYNQLANQTLIQYYFTVNQFERCLQQCHNLLQVLTCDLLAIKYEILCYIELKKFELAKEKVRMALQNCGDHVELFLLNAEINVCQQDFDTALITYQKLYEQFPSFFSTSTLKSTPKYKQHFSNVNNLLKRNSHKRMQSCLGSSDRVDRAIDCFFGLKEYVRNHPLQKGSFFNIPDLTAKPFYQVSEIAKLDELISQLNERRPLLDFIIDNAVKENYIDTIASKTKEKDWLLLSKKWQSIHLLKAKPATDELAEIREIQKIFVNDLVADCPPHAPEAFISILPSNTVIPSHYGLSNVKLTVHVPLYVDQYSSITVGGESKTWFDDGVIVFDDSFLHSAENQSTDHRTVLIFDIWHPDLNKEERMAIRAFMSKYEEWSQQFGKLANAVQMITR